MRLKKAEREFIAFQRVCRVATVGRDGAPHNVPVCPLLDGEHIYFASEAGAVKVRHLRTNQQVALVFDEYTEAWANLRGILIRGTARVIPGGPAFRRLRKRFYQRYAQYESFAALEERDSVIVEVAPKRTISWGL